MSDWTHDVVDLIDTVVGTARDKTVIPARRATKAVVYGLLVAFFVAMALFLLVIALFRILVVLTGEAWISYLILGGIFVIGGAFCWAQRNRLSKDLDD